MVQDPADATGATPMAVPRLRGAAADRGDLTQKPKPFVPFAMPMRLTDNAKCNPENPAPYCNGLARGWRTAVPRDLARHPMDYGLKDMCTDLIDIPTGNDRRARSPPA